MLKVITPLSSANQNLKSVGLHINGKDCWIEYDADKEEKVIKALTDYVGGNSKHIRWVIKGQNFPSWSTVRSAAFALHLNEVRELHKTVIYHR
jgi:hypothetical protein